MLKVINNLLFSGNCREAFEHYANVLDGKITAMVPFREVPQEMPFAADFADTIMHAWLDIGEQSIMGCDVPPEHRTGMAGFSVAIHVNDGDEARRYYDGLIEGGTARMAFGPTFWSPAFGMLVDRFGTPWTINTNADVSL